MYKIDYCKPITCRNEVVLTVMKADVCQFEHRDGVLNGFVSDRAITSRSLRLCYGLLRCIGTTATGLLRAAREKSTINKWPKCERKT